MEKCGVQQTDSNFVEAFSPPPIEQKTPLDYFTMFFPESLLQVIVDLGRVTACLKKFRLKHGK